MIKVINLKKHYEVIQRRKFLKKEIKVINAVNGINIDIEKGKVTGLIGLNGAGKTTIIKTLSTILSADEGIIEVDGFNIEDNEDIIKTKLNIITSGDRGLYWQLTGRENLEYFGALYDIPKNELSNRVNYLLKFVELEDRADEPVERYSKGMKQRLQIARGLINNPEYILMDEPTLGLDINISKVLRNKIKELVKEQEKGILLTTHYISEIEELCDYVYVLDKGKIVYEGTTSEIIQKIGNNEVKYIIELENYSKHIENELKSSLDNCLIIKVDTTNKITTLKVSSSENITNILLNTISKHTNILKFYTVEPNLEEAILQFIGSKSYE